ncbi:MAG TPA: MlaD family protein, partial [Solirubrobacteraceae bacterium]|nr:MlaD family protein [Solirubrobacteraceae bacterium]
MTRAIKTHMGDFAAIIVLLLLSIVVAGYVLSHERFRFPFIEASPYTLNAEFSTAQAVTPGQGQSVRVSGVQIGEIGSVSLKNGVAIVQLQIDPKYKNLIHTNATALLRPKTGLKDMFVEVQPGSKPAPVAKQGWTLPVSNTLPDIDADEILSSLDGDTRNYLQLLVNGAGQGLKGKGGSELAQVFERFEPTHRDLARLNKAVAVRGTDLRQLVNSLQRLNTALSHNQGQIVRLVDASSTVFRAFASQDTNISAAIRDLPGTLAQTTDT